METLLEALPTPTYSVQEAVSDSLAPMMSGLATDKAYVQSLAQRLLTATLTGPDYPHRYGVPFCWKKKAKVFVSFSQWHACGPCNHQRAAESMLLFDICKCPCQWLLFMLLLQVLLTGALQILNTL